MDFPHIRTVDPVRAAGAALVALIVAVAAVVAVQANGAVSQVRTLYSCIMPSGGPARVWAFAPTCDGGQVVHWSVSGTTSIPPTTVTSPSTGGGTTKPTNGPTSTSQAPGGSNAKPPAGGYFALSAPGATLPSDASCAAQVHRSTWEPRPDNAKANATVPPAGFVTGTNPDWNSTWNSSYRPRIDGNFTGTTDEIIQWAACKWGWPDDLVRGEAIDESNWHQNATGDTSSSSANCFPGYSTPCPTSFGFLQVKWFYAPSHALSGNAMPWARDATAWSLDYSLSQLRGCYEGMSTFLGNTRGNVNGCLQAWFQGSWSPNGGSYSARVQQFTADKAWLRSGF